MTSLAEHADRVAARAMALADDSTGRVIVAIAGPPGSGKSTLADAVVERLNASAAPVAVAVPMDGFHFDDAVLHARGQRPRKGAPFTFDVAGYRALLHRLRDGSETEIAAPLFDRDLELSRGSARIVTPEMCFIVTEGNYLLLDADPWRSLVPLFDLTVFLDVPDAELQRRLEARWVHYGLSPEQIADKIGLNDLPNARLIRDGSMTADLILPG